MNIPPKIPCNYRNFSDLVDENSCHLRQNLTFLATIFDTNSQLGHQGTKTQRLNYNSIDAASNKRHVKIDKKTKALTS